jgi:hypothetical protein
VLCPSPAADTNVKQIASRIAVVVNVNAVKFFTNAFLLMFRTNASYG